MLGKFKQEGIGDTGDTRVQGKGSNRNKACIKTPYGNLLSLNPNNKYKRTSEGCHTKLLTYAISRSSGLPISISSTIEVDQGGSGGP